MAELRSIRDWEQACSERQARSLARREPSVHPWPEHGYWLDALVVASCLIVLGFVFLVGVAALVPA